jgi:hypothetical protein
VKEFATIRGPELHVDGRQQEHRDDLSFREVGLEQVGLLECSPIAHLGLGRGALCQFDHVRVVFNAQGTGAALRGGDDRAAVARTEVDEEVLRRELRHVEHLVDEGLRRRHPHDVLPGLSDLRLERLGRRLGLGMRDRGDGQAQEEERSSERRMLSHG